jgi:hypothetical protein
MSRKKAGSTRKHSKKAVVIAGVSLSLAGGGSASPGPTDTVPKPTTSQQSAALSEEEIAEVSLSTLHVFDKEDSTGAKGAKVAWWRACRGCRGCGCRSCSNAPAVRRKG